MTDRAGRLGRRGLERLRSLTDSSIANRSLRHRVAELEDEMQEARRLNRRLAELMDVVEELLVPLSQQDDDRVQKYLSSNITSLGGGSAGGAARVTRDESSGSR